MPAFRICLAATVCALALAPQAMALTVGEYRAAHDMAHVLDSMTTDQREAYVAAHRPELELAHAKLEAAESIAETLIAMNLLQMEVGRPPFVCNYDEETNGEIEVDDWIDEYRKEAPVRFKLEPGPKTDQILDQVEVDDVIAHKMMEKYPCPIPKGYKPATTTAHKAKHAKAAKTAAADTAQRR